MREKLSLTGNEYVVILPSEEELLDLPDDYSIYLPHINVSEGTARVMGNLELYKRLLLKFKGRQMADDLLQAINSNDSAGILQYSHALRGTAGNLGFPVVYGIAGDIEDRCKAGQASNDLCEQLNSAIDDLDVAIAGFTA